MRQAARYAEAKNVYDIKVKVAAAADRLGEV